MINLLPQSVVNQIAAGEVVERPASVLKELLENSIDANATDIKVFIQEFGTNKIQVIDNGSGIENGDFERVFLKHATSKISNIDDLISLLSYGFRGEALASISSVSKVILETKHKNDNVGSEITYDNGQIVSIKPSAITEGTNIQILNLFENIPARKKFLKSRNTESKALMDIFNKFALANFHINFSINIDGISKTYPAGSLAQRISKLFKINEEDLISIQYDGTVKVSGYVIHPRVFLKNKNAQTIFVNKRIVNDTTIYKAIVDGYDTFLMKNQYPGFVVFVDVPPSQIDVNVHPRKTEVRFSNVNEVYKSVRFAVNNNLVRNLKEEMKKKLEVISEKENLEEKVSEGKSIDVNDILNTKIFPDSQEIKIDRIQLKNSNPNQTEFNENIEIEATIISEKSPADEFEEFLKSDNSREEVRLSNKSSRVKSFISEKAILFNKEIIAGEEKEDDNNKLNLDFVNATQLLNSYIITSNSDSLLIIDQHAASERFFYEKFLNEIRNKKVDSKLLLFPEVITLDEHEIKILEENKDLFIELGFDFEIFGEEEIKVTKVPNFVKMDDFKKVIERIIKDTLEDAEISNVKDKIHHEIAAIIACHTAVRFGDKLSKEEIIKILNNLSTCEDPYNCPHGRPIIQDLTKYDIEKKFKRCGL